MEKDYDTCRLEYNEIQGGFHVDPAFRSRDGVYHHWKIICEKISDNQCREFIRLMNSKYPDTSWETENRNPETAPATETIEAEFVEFLKT